jgi:hypothetical protein
MNAKTFQTGILAVFLLALALPAVAQVVSPPEPLVAEGEIIPGVGAVTSISNLAINNTGGWLVEADTDNPDTTADSVLIKSGALFLREGDGLSLPLGAALGSFDSININDSGNSGWNFFLDNLPSGQDSGVYFNSTLVIQEGDISTAPEFTPGTPYLGYFDVKMNNGNLMLLVASMDDPAIVGSVDRALLRVQVDGTGALISESVHAKEGDILPGQVEPVADFGTGPHQSDINDSGQLLFFADLAGSTSTDGAIYRDMTLLAQEGSPSPVAGRLYQFLSSRGLDLNNNGNYVFKANLDGSTSDDDLIIVDGSVFRREGDSLPAIGGFTFTSFGTSSGPVKIDDDGDVLWFGDWNDPDTTVDTGLFLNDRLIVQEGVTSIGGLVVDTISSGSDAFDMSDDGSFVIFEATLAGGINGAFRIEISDGGGGGPNEPPVALCRNVTVTVDENCRADASIDAGSFDPDGDPITLSQSPPGPYDIGDTTVTLTVTDDGGLSDTCTGTVTVVDPVPPEISVALDPAELWPPNHRMIDVDAIVTATDNCSTPAVELVSVTSSEPDNGEGDGDTINDIQGADLGTADFLLQLRAERAGTGNGRTYTATYTATDSSGNQASGAGTAFVPHDQGGKTDPVETTMSKTGKGSKLDWTDVPGASYYNVIRGDLGSLWVDVEAIHLGTVRCVRGQTVQSDTEGQEDPDIPAVGEAFFYVVEYVEAGARSGYGTESAPKPRVVDAGDCE